MGGEVEHKGWCAASEIGMCTCSGEVTYKDAWESLRNTLREEKEREEKRREDALKGGHDPGLPAIHYSTVLNLMANLEHGERYTRLAGVNNHAPGQFHYLWRDNETGDEFWHPNKVAQPGQKPKMIRRGGAWACCHVAFDDEEAGIPHTKDRCAAVDVFPTTHRQGRDR